MKFFVLFSPEDTVVKAEHIESGHSGDYRHHPTHYRAVLEASCQNLIFREETREWGDTRNGETSNQECPMGNRHIFA